MSTRVVPGILDLPGGDWDRLVGPDGFYTTHRWLRGLHNTFGADRVLVAEDPHGGLLGGLPTWPGDGSALFDPRRVLPTLAGDWPAGWLWLGARRATRNELVGTARPVLHALLAHALALARQEGRPGLFMPYLPARHALLLAAAHPRAEALLHSADAAMPIPPGGLEGHLAGLSGRDRNRRLREARAAREAGTRWLPFTRELQVDAVRLITQNRARYGGSADEGWMRRVFDGQRAAGLLDDAYAGLATRDGRPYTMMIFYGRGNSLHARYFGFDYANARPAGEYFLLLHHMPLRHGAAAGFRRYHLGISAWRGKVRRGAELSPLAAVVLPVEGRACTVDRAADHNAGMVRAWRALAPDRPRAYSPDWDLWDHR